MIDVNRWFGSVAGLPDQEQESPVQKALRLLSPNAAPADAPGGAAPPAPGGVSSAPPGAPPAPWEMAGANDGGQMMLKENDETAPMGGADAMLPGDGGVAPTPEYDPRDADQGLHESRPAPIMPTDPTVSDPAYTQSPTGMTYGPIEQGEVQGPQAPPQSQIDRYVPSYAPQAAQVAPTMPSPAAGAVQAGIDAAVESYNDPFFAAGPQPPRWVKIVSDAMQAFGSESAKNVARSLGVTDEEWFNVFGFPISRVDVAGFAGGIAADPTTYIGANMADPMLTVARGAVRDFAPQAVQNVGRAVGSTLREGAEAVGRGLQNVGREVAGQLMDMNPAMTPRIIGDGPGIGRSLPGPDDVPTPSSLTPPAGGRPQQRTVEWLAEQIDHTRRVLDDLDPATEGELIGQVQDRLARLQGEWVDAVNARRALEPRIRSEVGRRVNELPLDERTASDYAGIGRERVSPEAGIPRTVDDTPRSPGLNSAPAYNGRGAGIGAQAAADAGASLQGGVVGAAAGYGMPADSEEERRRNALAFGAAGMVGMPVAGRVVGRGMRGAGPGTRAGIVPPHVADQMGDTFPVRIPQDPKTIRAIESIGGTIDPQRGVTINVTRAQGPQAAGMPATRGGVFYEAVPPGGRSENFVRQSDDPTGVGGSQVIPARPTTFRSPLIVSDAPGSGGFNDAMRQMGGEHPAVVNAERAVESARAAENDAYDRRQMLMERWYEQNPRWTPEQATQFRASPEYLDAEDELARLAMAHDEARAALRQVQDAYPPISVENINADIRRARQAGPEGSEARAQALKAAVAKYGGDPELIDPLLRVRGADASESEWAIRENILAAHARRNGYDGVVTVENQNPGWEAINSHPAVVAASKAYDDAVQAWRAGSFANPSDALRLADEVDQASAAIDDAKRLAERELSAGRITELIDVREGANPTPGRLNPLLEERERAIARIEEITRDVMANPSRSPEESTALVQEITALRQRLKEIEPELPAAEANRYTGDPGFTVRPDIQRPPGAQWAALPFDPASAAMGGAAGAMSEGEDGEAGDPLRTAAGIGLGAFGARVTRVKPPIAANAQRVAAEAAAGARNGVRMNAPLAGRPSNVPFRVRKATQFTDDRAAMRWAEDVLSDAAGSPRMAEMDPARPSTLSRINAASIGTQRVDEELGPAVELAAEHGLHHELPQYLADRHQLDILDDAYDAAYRASREAAQEPIDKAKQFGANPGTIARMEARADAEAEKAGMVALKKAQGPGLDNSYEAIDARLKGVEQRMAAAGKQQQLDEAAQMVWDHNRQSVERARDAGIISQEEADDLLDRFPHLVPTRGETSLRPDGSDAGGTLLERFTSNDAPVNPIVASRMNTLRSEREIQRNAVMQAFGRLIDDAVSAGGIQPGRGGRLSLWDGEKAVSWYDNGQRVTVHLPGAVADGLEAAANMGVSHNAVIDLWKRVAGFITSSITSARASFVPVNLVRDLQDFAIRTSAEEGGPQTLPRVMGAWLRQAGAAAADLAASNFTVRGGVGAVTGAVTGATQGDENTTMGERVRNAALMGAAGTVLIGANRAQITGDAQKFLARGGGSGGINTGLRSSERWYREVSRNGGAVLKTPQDAANYFRDWLSDIATLQGVRAINDRVELIPRAAAMRRAEARGLSETEAVVAGRDVTYDPDRAGTVVRAANGLVPFLNATVQSGAQVKRLFQKHPGAAALTMVSTLGPVMLLAEAWNRSDPDRAKAYDDVPQYAKDSGIVVVSPWAGSDARGERPLYGVIPTGLATPFAVVMREALRSVPGLEPAAGRSTTDPEAGAVQRWTDVLSEAIQVFNPVKGDSASSVASSMVPPGVKQGIELGLNKDLYRGAPIVSDSADERASAFSRKVAEGANAAGRMIGSDFLQEVKPSGVEYMVRQAPAYGDIITGASDMIAPGGQKQAEDRPVANLPGVGGVASRFVKDAGGANLERAANARLSEGVRSILEDAGLPPSTIKPVPSRYRNATLTREEQVRWQEATNVYLEEELMNARDSALWDDPARREEAIQKATTKARDLAAREVLGLTASDIRERVEAGAARKGR